MTPKDKAKCVELIRKLLCWLFGHRSICLYRHHTYFDDHGQGQGSETTGWKCERCEHTFTEGWDA